MPTASIRLAAPISSSRPTKPLLRRATLSGTVRNSDDAGLDAESLLAPPSPSKRARVSFDPNVEEKIVDGRSVEAVKVEIRRAIEAHIRGDNEEYDIVKEVFAPKENDMDWGSDLGDEEVKKYVLALTSSVSLLSSSCSGLVNAILNCEWLGRDEGFVKAYIQFLGNLVSAQGSYVGMVIGMLVGHFTGGTISSFHI